MSITTQGWKNKKGTGDRDCVCGSWKAHWIKFAGRAWPSTCSVDGCSNTPTVGAHVINPAVPGERIAPLCDSCNKVTGTFDLKGSIAVPSANRFATCEISS